MKKKILMMLPCIAAVTIATFVGKKTFELNAFGGDTLLAQDVEALSQGESGGIFIPCYEANSICPVNIVDASGREGTMYVSKAVKAAPYK